MWRALLPFALLFIPTATPLLAQAPSEPPLGATLRWTDGGRTHEGRLVAPVVAPQPYHVVLYASSDTVLVSRAPGYRAWRSRGSQKLLGAGVGLGAGALIGYVIGNANDEEHDFFHGLETGLGTGIGAAVGVLVGAIVFPGAEWTVLNQSMAVGVLLAPGRAGVRLTF